MSPWVGKVEIKLLGYVRQRLEMIAKNFGEVTLPIPNGWYIGGRCLTESLSLSGHTIRGDRIVRMIFFDAAGLSNPTHEPFIVVAGVILHADKQWKAVTQYLSDMADEYAPPEYRNGFAFHATELFSGGRRFARERYTRDLRWHILDELVAIPAKFDLPIVWGYIARSQVEAGGDSQPVQAPGWKISPVVHGQIIAFICAISLAEKWMNSVADQDEIAQIIMENDSQSRKFYAFIQRGIADQRINSRFSNEFNDFKLNRIIYPMHFEDKTDSSALQIADVCSFALKRWCMGTPEAKRFYEPLAPCIVNNLKPGLVLSSLAEAVQP